MSFEGLRVLVTGSTRGIGKATARAFLDAGALVAINGRRAGDVERTMAELGGTGTVAAAGDLGSAAACRRAVEAAIAALGGLDVLVNNAGVYDGGPIEGVSEQAYERLMAVNVKGVFFCSQAAIPELRRNRGAIVITASESGLVGNGDSALYCASKGAVVNMTRAFAHDLAPDIRVNAICPGAVMTDMLGNDDQEIARIATHPPMKRIATAEEIGAAIRFLADPAQGSMTGALLAIDGGSVACR